MVVSREGTNLTWKYHIKKSNFENKFRVCVIPYLTFILLVTTSCRLVDGQDPGSNSLILNSIVLSATTCNVDAFVAEIYTCQPDVTISDRVDSKQLIWELTDNHTCTWAQINPTTGQLFGSPDRAHIGSCVLAFRVTTASEPTNDYSLAINVSGPKINFSVNNCGASAAVGNAYQCDFDATTPLQNAQFSWSLAADNNCSWASIDPLTGVVLGTPALSSIGSCILSINTSIENLSTSNIKKTLTVPSVPVNVTASCSTTLDAGTLFSCTPLAAAPILNPQFTWSLTSSNTCAWARINTSTGQITGSPLIYSAGNCRLDIIARISTSSFGQWSTTLNIRTKGYNELLLPESAGDAGEGVGSAVSINGNWAIVGSPDDTGGGSAAVYQFDGTTWSRRVTLTSPDPVNILRFGYSVSVSGNSILVGAPYSRGSAFNEGAVVAYEFSGTTWTHTQTIWSNLTSKSQLHFGAAVDLDGTRAIVATSHYQGEAAYILQKSGSIWSIGAPLPFAAVNSANGPGRIKVALHANLAVVYDNRGGASQDGEVRVYRNSGGTWALDGILTSITGTGFGSSLDVYNNRILIGAPTERSSAGSAYLFENGGSSWVNTKIFRAVDEASHRNFGQSVALSGTQIVIGAPSDSPAAGSAYVYNQEATDWPLFSKLMPTAGQAADGFGVAVGISTQNILIGADLYDFNSTANTGAAFIFQPK